MVARGLELVEGVGLGGPLANAAIARDTGEPQTAAMPATIGGKRRMLRLHDMPLPTGGVAGFAVDIEELEQARGGLKRFAAAQRAMLDRISAGVAQFGADRSLIFSNQPFRRMFAVKNEWLADRPEFDRVLDRMREANRLPEVRDYPAWKAERREWFVSPDAVEETWSLGATHLRVVAQPLPEGGLLLLFEDQTQQFELQREHGEMQQVRTATLESLAEAVAVFGKGRLQLWNRKFRQVWDFEDAFLDGHPQVQQLVRAAGPRLAKSARAEVIGDLIRIAAQDRQSRGSSIAFADGRHFDITAVPLPDGNALVTMLDTTDHHRAERALRDRNEALEAADRVKTAFVANMSYELRTPLTSIKGFAEMLHGGFAGPLSASGGEYAEAILVSVERLGLLIDDVLDLTQSEGAPLETAPVDIEIAAQNAAEAVAPLARAKGIELVVEDAGSAGSITGDARRIRQVAGQCLKRVDLSRRLQATRQQQLQDDRAAVRLQLQHVLAGVRLRRREVDRDPLVDRPAIGAELYERVGQHQIGRACLQRAAIERDRAGSQGMVGGDLKRSFLDISAGAETVVVVGQHERAGAGLDDCGGVVEVGNLSGVGAGARRDIDGLADVDDQVVGDIDAILKVDDGAAVGGERAGAERIVITEAECALVQAGATGIGVGAVQCQRSRAELGERRRAACLADAGREGQVALAGVEIVRPGRHGHGVAQRMVAAGAEGGAGGHGQPAGAERAVIAGQQRSARQYGSAAVSAGAGQCQRARTHLLDGQRASLFLDLRIERRILVQTAELDRAIRA